MSHNYYLYNDPATGQLTWISWDHNNVLGGSPGGQRAQTLQERQAPGAWAPENEAAPPDMPQAGARPAAPEGMGFGGHGVSLGREEVGENWPLIRYLLDDPVYHEAYLEYVEQAAALIEPSAMQARIDELAALLSPYVEDQASFAEAVEALTGQIAQCYETATAFIASQ